MTRKEFLSLRQFVLKQCRRSIFGHKPKEVNEFIDWYWAFIYELYEKKHLSDFFDAESIYEEFDNNRNFMTAARNWKAVYGEFPLGLKAC